MAPNPVPFNFFTELRSLKPDDLHELREFRLDRLLKQGWNPGLGTTCRSSSGRRYLYGPWAIERFNQWQTFILSTRNKRFGRLYHYSHFEDHGPTPWTDFVDRYRIPTPLDDVQARWLVDQVNHRCPLTAAVIFSGSLLADLLLWADRNKVEMKRDMVFTTFEPLPLSVKPLLDKYFDDWCDYMRCWEGGLTFWRCPNGVYHTLDNATVLDVDDHGMAAVTDLTNFAQSFVKYTTGDIIELSIPDGAMCECGMPHRGFRMLGGRGWDLVADGGERVSFIRSFDDLPAGYQVFQPRQGEVVLLKPEGWKQDGGFNLNQPADLAKRISSHGGFNITFSRGYLRRRDKKPPVFSRASTGRRYCVVAGGYLPQIDCDFAEL